LTRPKDTPHPPRPGRALRHTRFSTQRWPKTLHEAVVYFSDPHTAFAEMVNFRWPDGVVRCPTCGSAQVYFIAAYWIWKCRTNHPRRQFSIKAGSIMENSKLGIDKWLIAVWLITNARSGVSSYELARAIGVPQKSAWSMLRRIRLAMQDEVTRNHRRARGA